MKSSYQTLYLVDVSSFIFRAFYAVRELTAPDGTPVNAVYGVASMLGRLLEEVNPQYLAIVYDSKEPSFRKEIYADYKANRSDTPEMLIPQFDLIENLISYMGIPSFRQSTIEADDLIATLHRRWLEAAPEHRVVVVTGDKDLMALVNSKAQLWDTMKDVHYTEHEVIEKFGVKPNQIRDYLAMVGDTSDNIPGITGIGPKGAEVLLKEFQTLEGVIAAAKQGKIKGKKCEMIVECEKQALLSQTLATLKDDVALEITPEQARFDFRVKPELLQFFQKYNLKSLYTKYSNLMQKQGGSLAPAVAQNTSSESPSPQVGFSFDATENTTSAKKSSPTKTPASVHSPEMIDTQELVNSSHAPHFSLEQDRENQSFIDLGKPEFITVSTLEALKKLIVEIKTSKMMSLDTETTSLDPKLAELVGIAIAVSEKAGFYIPVGHQLTLDSKITQLDKSEVLAALKEVLESKEIKKIGQNLKYDIRVLLNQGIRVQGLFADTMVAAYALDSSGRHNLDYLCKKYLNYEVVAFESVVGKGASQITFDQVPIEAATRYSAEDAWTALMLWKVLEPKLQAQGVEKLYREVDLPIVEVVVDMEEAGIKVDVPFLQKLETEFQKELKEIESKVLSLSQNQNMNLNSPKQLGQFLFEELKLPTQGKTKTGFSTDASVLEKLAPLHEAPRLLLEYREISKLMGTYVLPLQDLRSKKDSRIRTSFHLTGTATGRLSSSDPNLQNIPTRSKRGQKIREAFIAEEGMVFLSADYSQIELRILAHLSGDQSLVASFVNHEDVHRRTASEIFQVSPEHVSDEQRSFAKAINFGLMYGKSAFGLAEELGITRTEAKNMIEKYFTRYHGVKEFLDHQIIDAKERGYITTLLGRKRVLADIRSSNHAVRANAERMAMNSPIQGSASDLIKVAMVDLHRELEAQNFKSRILLQVHDELVLECLQNEVDAVKVLVKKIMENAIQMKVPLEVNLETGPHWAALKSAC